MNSRIIIATVVGILAVATMGLLLGWLIGVSRSPIVASVVPGILAVITVVGAKFLFPTDTPTAGKRVAEDATSNLATVDRSTTSIAWGIAIIVMAGTVYATGLVPNTELAADSGIRGSVCWLNNSGKGYPLRLRIPEINVEVHFNSTQ